MIFFRLAINITDSSLRYLKIIWFTIRRGLMGHVIHTAPISYIYPRSSCFYRKCSCIQEFRIDHRCDYDIWKFKSVGFTRMIKWYIFCVGNHLLLISQADFSNNNEEILFFLLLLAILSLPLSLPIRNSQQALNWLFC